MTKDEILKKYEDDNEYHFHEVDRAWIMEAMEEYAEQQVKNNTVLPHFSNSLPKDTDGCGNDRDKCSCKNWGGCPVD